MSKLPKSDRHPQYKSTSCCLSSISSTKNSTFQCSSIYELHFTYKFIYVFVLQFYDPNLVVQFMYIKNPLDQQIEQVSTIHISSFKTVSDLPHNGICHHRQLLTLPILNNRSPSIVIITIDRKLIILNLEYFSSFNSQ